MPKFQYLVQQNGRSATAEQVVRDLAKRLKSPEWEDVPFAEVHEQIFAPLYSAVAGNRTTC